MRQFMYVYGYQIRSKTTLPGNIRQYLIDTASSSTSTMPGTPPPPTTEPLDMQTLLTMMTQTMGSMSESRTGFGNKLEDCPVKRTLSSLDAWMKEVLLWNESNTSSVTGWNAKKYLKFLDSVLKSEGSNDPMTSKVLCKLSLWRTRHLTRKRTL